MQTIVNSNYTFNSSNYDFSAPSMSVDLNNITVSQLNNLKSAYMSSASEYSNSFQQIIVVRDYVSERLEKDLSIRCQYMTKQGVDKQNNIISLHNKADNLYAVSLSGRPLDNEGNIDSIKTTYHNLYTELFLNDEKLANIIFTEGQYGDNQDYDRLAKTFIITIDGLEKTLLFLNKIPNAIGTQKIFENYITITNTSGRYENTLKYVIYYQRNLQVNGNDIEAWVLKQGENIVCYTIDDILINPGTSGAIVVTWINY